MRRLASEMLLVLLLFGLLATSRYPPTTQGKNLHPAPLPRRDAARFPAWSLALTDHFEQPTIDPTKWITCLPWGRENPPELEYYAEDAFDLGISSHNRVKAEKRQLAGYAYTSGALTSHGLFSLQYGYVEIRAKIPAGKGLWPAFWLLAEGEDWPKEIDVFEILGNQPDTVYMTNHWKGPNGEHLSDQGIYTGPDFSRAFHTFAVEWQPSQIIWFVDGVERFRTNQGVPTEPMYLITNLAVGGDWPGSPDASTVFPAYLDIDYIAAYEQGETDSPNHVWLPVTLSAD